eukprot:TRINITY_DN5981_c0_g1_i7.p1 TRINITY_DN5981_c0_g1~~TRINITY_DN5981_c0_g1_i7.p1  ORF type:complete len:249 (-),score=43.35 TRINITY_DN5981_c0_g1_i7:349-1095(-)
MGGGYYDRDVSSVDNQQQFSAQANAVLRQQRSLHPELNPFQRAITCSNRTPIVLCVDVTGSMGKWPKVIWDKLPMFYGQLLVKNYVPDPAFSFCAIGDAYGDESPLQVAPFATGTTIDDYIGKLHVESGGGGALSDHETYELAAYYYSKFCKFSQQPHKPFFFFMGDEAFYPTVNGDHIQKLILGERPEDLDSIQVFQDLKNKFDVYCIHKILDYGGPDDVAVLTKWQNALGEDHVIRLDNPKVNYLL